MSEPGTAKRGLPLRVKMRHGAHFVDELTARNESSIGKLLPLSSVRPNPDQPRTQVGDLTDLVSSIRDKGVLEPILVRRSESVETMGQGAKFEIIAGERRYRAALEAGLFEIPAIELEVSAEEALEITLIENLQRKDLNAFEEAEGYNALGGLHGYTQEQIAQAVGRSRSAVAESLSLLSIPKETRERILALGIQAKSALLELAKVSDPKALEALMARASRQGFSRDDLRKELRKAPAAGRGGQRKKPFAFKFRSPDKSFALQLQFRQSSVEKSDLIRALEQILAEIRNTPEA
ncbi:MAG: ParB/RepB/Spo0J family partition protein [Thermoanaerobaculia bacterium]